MIGKVGVANLNWIEDRLTHFGQAIIANKSLMTIPFVLMVKKCVKMAIVLGQDFMNNVNQVEIAI